MDELSYRSGFCRLKGTYRELYDTCRNGIFRQIKQRTNRNPYLRSKHFKRDKIFLSFFWTHIMEKRFSDRQRRLRYYEAALDLLRNTTYKPTAKPNPNNSNEILHRFSGITSDGGRFVVQVKENIKTGRKDFVSIIPK